MAGRRVVIAENGNNASTLNDRFRKLQESGDKRPNIVRKPRPTRTVTVSHPRGGISKTTGRLKSNVNGRGRDKSGPRANGNQKPRSSNRGRGRGRGNRARRGRSERQGTGKTDEKKKADLDKELEAYLLEDKDKGKELLDTEIEEYMSNRETQATTDQQEHQDE